MVSMYNMRPLTVPFIIFPMASQVVHHLRCDQQKTLIQQMVEMTDGDCVVRSQMFDFVGPTLEFA